MRFCRHPGGNLTGDWAIRDGIRGWNEKLSIICVKVTVYRKWRQEGTRG